MGSRLRFWRTGRGRTQSTTACQVDTSTKNPALVVFRLCFGTWSEHLGQAGCFRLPVKSCRPQPPLCVPELSNLRSKRYCRWPRTGQGKFRFTPGKERDSLGRITRASIGNRKRKNGRKGERQNENYLLDLRVPICIIPGSNFGIENAKGKTWQETA